MALASNLCLLQFSCGDLLDDVCLNLIADFYVIEPFKADTAFKALADFANVFLESPHGSNAAFPRNDPVTDQPGSCIAANYAVYHHTSRDGANLRYTEHFAYVRFAQNALL